MWTAAAPAPHQTLQGHSSSLRSGRSALTSPSRGLLLTLPTAGRSCGPCINRPERNERMDLNKVTLIGNLVGDPKRVGKVVSFSVATNYQWERLGEKRQSVDFHDIASFGKL